MTNREKTIERAKNDLAEAEANYATATGKARAAADALRVARVAAYKARKWLAAMKTAVDGLVDAEAEPPPGRLVDA